MVTNNFTHDKYNTALLSWACARRKMGASGPTPRPATSLIPVARMGTAMTTVGWVDALMHGPSWANQSPSLEF